MKRIVIASLFGLGMLTAVHAQTPPITPAWAFRHIVWEDSLNTETGAKELVDGYLSRGIPVEATIIDSPWSTAYNDFNWDKARYPDPEGMLSYFKRKDVKVILWLTGVVNQKGHSAAAVRGLRLCAQQQTGDKRQRTARMVEGIRHSHRLYQPEGRGMVAYAVGQSIC